MTVSPNTLAKNSGGGSFGFSGTGVPGASVSLSEGSNAFACCAFVGATGSWSWSVSVDNPDGSYTKDSLAFQALGTRAGGEFVTGLDY